MAQQIGRISGPVLSDNLLRNGTNLDFRNQSNSTPLLKLDVVNGRIAINSSTASRDLFINGTTRSVDIIATTQATVGSNLQFLNSEINSLSGSINIDSQEQIVVSALATQDIIINDNRISTRNTNSEINFIPAGTGNIELTTDVNIFGNLHATGNITADGNIIIGDSDTDNVEFKADFGNSIIPAATNTYSIGSINKRWDSLYSNLLNGKSVVASEIVASGGGNFALKQGNIFFVSVNGNDANGGDNVQNPFRTLKAALDAADASTSGPVTVQIFAGDYEEEFPLTVPSNVTVQGVDMRNTIIKPTVATQYNDAFLLNGESTVQNLTIKDFYSNKSFIIDQSADNGIYNSKFGQAVSIRGSYAVIGAPNALSENNRTDGRAYVYNIETNTRLHTLINPLSYDYDGGGDKFGASVDISDDYVIVGAPGADSRGNEQDGSTHVYSTATGEKIYTLVKPDSDASGNFGNSVSISGNFAIVGHPGRSDVYIYSGYAYIYDLTTGTRISDIRNPNPYGTRFDDRFGQSVSISGNYAIVGAYQEDELDGTNSGKVYIYKTTIGDWTDTTLLHTLNNPNVFDTSLNDYFGTRVAIDGNYAIVGTTSEDDSSGTSSGKAYIFNVTTGVLLHTLDNPNVYGTSAGDRFGGDVAISGNYAIVGARWEDSAVNTSVGVAYVFDVTTGDLVYTKNSFERYTGTSVSIDNGRILVGSDGDSLNHKASFTDVNTLTTSAFKFSPNTVVSTRSPYVQNVSVITKGTITSASDPRGFGSGDAGRGAYIDGASVNSSSNEASMLFHSVTFITPGVDAVTMTNGVRVEWLNSFTYFANRGLYAVDGVTGHLSTDGSTVKYGAELRSIGSANVYGNYGAVADGVDTLMYLIQHNFSYVGAAADTTNDNTLTIPQNETIELNNGRVVFNKIDQQGNYSVGSSLIVNQETGNIAINATISDFSLVDALTITTGTSSIVISNTQIDTGFININDNTISSIGNSLNINAPTGINLNNNTNVQSDLFMSGSILIGGTLSTLGNVGGAGIINLDAEIDTNILPSEDSRFNLGSVLNRWNTLYADHLYIDELEIYDNVITTTESNADLELAAAGTKVIVDQLITQHQFLQYDGVTNTVTGLVETNSTTTLDSDLLVTASNGSILTNVTTENLFANSGSLFDNVAITNNVIDTTLTDSNLDLRANGTGEILLQENVIIQNNLSVNSTISSKNINVQQDVNLNQLIGLNNIKIDDNFIETFVSNSNLELRANGTGIVKLSDVNFTSNIITTNSNLSLKTATSVIINSTDSLVMPKGTTAEQWPSPQSGMIGYNSSINKFTGRTNNNNVVFGGIYSDNYLTNVQTNNNDLKFTISATPVATLTRNNVAQFTQLISDDVNINNNLISTNNVDLILNSQDSYVSFGNIKIKDDTIYATNDSIVDFSHTGTKSWTKFDNDQGLVFPIGNTANRPLTPELGQTRYNSQLTVLELYNGSIWAPAIGSNQGISAAEFEDMLDIYTLIFG
jgi:hypothetical protein